MPVTVTDVTTKENNDPTLPAFTTDNGTNRYKPSIMDSPGRKKIIKGLGGEKQFKDMTGLLRTDDPESRMEADAHLDGYEDAERVDEAMDEMVKEKKLKR